MNPSSSPAAPIRRLPAAAPSARLGPAGRDLALDAFRGLAVGGMILVNLQGNSAVAWPQAVHAAWHGLTLADLVFPYFLLAVGLSAALISNRNASSSLPMILRRAGLLFLIGLGLGWLLRPTFDLEQVRIPGVLQRIAVCYWIAAIACRSARHWWTCLVLAAGLLVLHWWALLVPAPGQSAATMDPGGGLSGWADRLLPGRLHGGTYDPEGILSTLSAAATTAIGAAIWHWQQRFSRMAAVLLSMGLIVLGLILHTQAGLPFNKTLWTPSFALFAAGTGSVIWLVLSVGGKFLQRFPVVQLLAWMGRVALTFYVVHMVLIAILRIPTPSARLWDTAWETMVAIGPAAGLGSMIFAVLAGGLCLALTRWLELRGWLLRV